jgi:hypothetical protein
MRGVSASGDVRRHKAGQRGAYIFCFTIFLLILSCSDCNSSHEDVILFQSTRERSYVTVSQVELRHRSIECRFVVAASIEDQLQNAIYFWQFWRCGVRAFDLLGNSVLWNISRSRSTQTVTSMIRAT